MCPAEEELKEMGISGMDGERDPPVAVQSEGGFKSEVGRGDDGEDGMISGSISALSSQTVNPADSTLSSSSSTTLFPPFSSSTPIFPPQPLPQAPQFIPIAFQNPPPPPPLQLPLPPQQQQLRPPSFLPVVPVPNAYLLPPPVSLPLD